MRVIWRARAAADIERIVAHIARENPFAAAQLGRELFLAGDSLVDFPKRGRPGRRAGTRELLSIYPYIILYRVREEEIAILRLWHGAQERW